MASFDNNIFYRLQSASAGINFSLDGDNDGMPNGFATLSLAPIGPFTGQFWQITITSEGLYQLCALWLGPDYRLGYWVNNDISPPTYYPGLFTGEPRRTPDQQWVIKKIKGTDGTDEQFSIKNNQAGFFMDLGADRNGTEFDVYLGGNQGEEQFAWKITAYREINDAAFSPVSSATTASATSKSGNASQTSKVATAVPTGSLPSAGRSTSTASPDQPVKGSNHLGIYIGVPIAGVFVIVLAIICWIFFRRRKLRNREAKEMEGSSPTSDSGNTGRDGSSHDSQSPVIQSFYFPDSPALGRKDSHEVSGTPVAEMESRGPEQKAWEKARSPLAEPTQGYVRGVAELEGDEIMTRRGVREV